MTASGPMRFAHLRERGAHVLGDVSLNSHLATPSVLAPTAVTMRTLRLSGSFVPREHMQARHAHPEEPRQRRAQCRRRQQHRRFSATFLTLCGL